MPSLFGASVVPCSSFSPGGRDGDGAIFNRGGSPSIEDQVVERHSALDPVRHGEAPVIVGPAGMPVEGAVIQPIVDATRPIRVGRQRRVSVAEPAISFLSSVRLIFCMPASVRGNS
jgi:hypothetical protein